MTVSLWQTSEAAWLEPSPVDVAIVGAGLLGAYLAFRLGPQGGSVRLLDARHAASGASGRNGGLLLTGIAHSYAGAVALYGRTTARDLWALTIRNREGMIDLATKLGTPVRRCGSYVLACTPEQHADLEAAAAMLREDQFPGTWHASDPLERGFRGAIATPDDGAIQAALLTAALVQHSRVPFYEQAEVYALESTSDGVLVRTRRGDLLARQVFLATNAWTPLLAEEFASYITPGRGQILATAPVPPILSQACYCDDGFEYFQQTSDGRFVLGGFRNLAFEAETTYADHTTLVIQEALERFLAEHYPELATVPIERRWSGTMAFTHDGLPLVGRLRRDERIAFAVGCNGHGLGLGIMAVDELLAELQGGVPSLFAARRLLPAAI